MNPDDLGFKPTTLIAGALGSVVALIVERPQIGPIGYVAALFVGCACANYLPSLIVSPFGLEHLENPIAFAAGLCGMHIASGLLNVAIRFEERPIKFVKAIFGKKDDR